MVYEWPTFTNNCLQLYLASSNQVILDSKNHAQLQSIKSKELCIQYCGLFLFITQMLIMSRLQLWALIKSLQVLTHMGYCTSSSFIGAWKGKRGGIVLLQQKAHRAIHLINHFLTKVSTTPATHTYHLQFAHSYSYLRHILKHMLRIKQHDCNELWRCKSCCPSHPLCLHGSRRRISLRKVDLFCP